jgi:hypothetical protein
VGASGVAGRRVVATARDVELLRLVGEQCVVTQPQLARAMGRTEHTARSARARWERAGWCRGGQLLTGRPPLVWLTTRGHTVTGIEFKPWRPTPLGRLEHIVAAAEARLVVAQRRPEVGWVCERELMREEHLRGGALAHRPDAEAVAPEGAAAVEVELTQKSRTRWERIARELLGRYEAVWYFAPPRLCERLGAWAADAGLERLQMIELPDPWRR